jgi:hypothetical protein
MFGRSLGKYLDFIQKNSTGGENYLERVKL